ncbi:MAG: hypothetical protein KKD18_05845 [Nanoarchaeota archaeon]|nr:hypothetical protein [Nanoarchaeota archaeon]MBU0977913.1 hypothetical protein [Nanoarchaeota archaeon]
MRKQKIIAYGEIFLIVSMSFAIAFIFNESFWKAGEDTGVAGKLWNSGGGVGGRVCAAGETLPAGKYGEITVPHDMVVEPPSPALQPAGNPSSLVAGKNFDPVTGKLLDGGGGGGTGVAGAGEAALPPGAIANVPAGQAGLMNSIFGGQAFGAGVGTSHMAIWGGALFSGLIWGAAVGGIAYLLAGMFGVSDNNAAAIGLGVGAGTFAGASLYLLGKNAALAGVPAQPGSIGAFVTSGFGAALIGIGIAATIIILMWKSEKKELVRFECLPWEPPTGGSHCEECNADPLRPCSEYRCKSLGQACDIVNPGTENEMCIWVGKGDTAAPHITPWDEALNPGGLRYFPDSRISPPNRGFWIQSGSKDGCLPAFTNLEFGFKTDEPAQCKIDYQPSDNYEDMNSFFVGESNLFLTEHTQKIKVVNTEGEGPNEPVIGIDGTFSLWVRCIDANGNGMDSAMVAFSYCVDPGPDTTAPTVEGSNVESGKPVQSGVDQLSGFEIYTNEPAECRWSRRDQAFSNMENTMECSSGTYQINANLNYVCQTSLTGIVDRQDNWFYFRCKDGEGNVMTTSYPMLLQGTEPLTITDVGPEGEFTGSTTVIPVTLTVQTAHGAKDGEATCSFSNTPEGRHVRMDGTGGVYLHNQTLDLQANNYIYYFRCVDEGGNLATANTTFSVVTDTVDPLITRVFRDGNMFKLITSEEAKCYYSNTNCNYELEDASPLLLEEATDRFVHTAPWTESVVYYIKCEDMQGNRPRPDECQIIVQASEL